MTEPNAWPPPIAKQFADMLAKPPVLPDPVFPPENFLAAFGRHFFQALLETWQRHDLVPQIADGGCNRQKAMFLVGWLGFWAFDFEEKWDNGRTVKDQFLDCVKEPIRRPPANMAAFTVEHHLVARGVLRIQIGGGPSLPGQYEICQLKTLGWYVAQMVSPKP